MKKASPTLLEWAFDSLSPYASGLGIGHTVTKIRAFKHGTSLEAIDLMSFSDVSLHEASFGRPIVARLLD